MILEFFSNLLTCLPMHVDPNQIQAEGYGKGVCNRFVRTVLIFEHIFCAFCINLAFILEFDMILGLRLSAYFFPLSCSEGILPVW